jgi:hypothetical protein
VIDRDPTAGHEIATCKKACAESLDVQDHQPQVDGERLFVVQPDLDLNRLTRRIRPGLIGYQFENPSGVGTCRYAEHD